jgi:hypothetical protein
VRLYCKSRSFPPVGTSIFEDRLIPFDLPPENWSTSDESPLGYDVAPVTRQFLTRNGDLFGDPSGLTLTDKLVRRQVAERAVHLSCS